MCLFGLNLQEGIENKKLISLLCLLMKHLIHLNKFKDEVGHPNELLPYILGKTYKIEKEIASKRGTETKMLSKWRAIALEMEDNERAN